MNEKDLLIEDNQSKTVWLAPPQKRMLTQLLTDNNLNGVTNFFNDLDEVQKNMK